MKRKTWLGVGLLLTGLLFPAPLRAQDSSPPADKWELFFNPYLWAAGIDGTLSIGPVEENVEVSFQNLLDSLDFGLMGQFEARRGHWSLWTDVVYTELGKDAETALPEVPVVLDMSMVIVEFGGGYRIGASPVEALVGGRFYSISAGVSVGQVTLAEGNTDWIDPFVGFRLRQPLGDRWILTLRGDVGGFGVGSDFAWSATGTIAYRLGPKVYAFAGYRAWSFEREGEHEIRELDAVLAGPGLGMSFRF